MTVADTPAIGFGAGERTLEGAGHLAREMSDLAGRDREHLTDSERFFAGAARDLLTVLVFCAAHGDLESTDTVEGWLGTLNARTTRHAVRTSLRSITNAARSTADQRTDARHALTRLERRTDTDPRTLAAVQATAIVALRDWTRQQTTRAEGPR